MANSKPFDPLAILQMPSPWSFPHPVSVTLQRGEVRATVTYPVTMTFGRADGRPLTVSEHCRHEAIWQADSSLFLGYPEAAGGAPLSNGTYRLHELPVGAELMIHFPGSPSDHQVAAASTAGVAVLGGEERSR